MNFGAPRVLLEGLVFPESLRWRGGRLWFVDMYDGTVMTLEPDGRPRLRLTLPGELGGIAWPAADCPVVVSRASRGLVRLDGTNFAGLPEAGSPLNDAIALADGSVLVGEFGFDLAAGAPYRPGNLYRIAPDLKVTVAADGLAFPNGMAIGDSLGDSLGDRGATLFVAESVANRIIAFDLDDEGTLTARRTFARLPGATPDGIALDSRGNLWIACLAAGEVVCLARDGAIRSRLQTPAPPVDVAVDETGHRLFVAVSRAQAEDLRSRPLPRTGQVIVYDLPQ